MRKLTGKSVYKGIAMGPAFVLKKQDQQVKRRKVEDAKKEIVRLENACEETRNQLQSLYEKAVVEVGESSAAIFESALQIFDRHPEFKARGDKEFWARG